MASASGADGGGTPVIFGIGGVAREMKRATASPTVVVPSAEVVVDGRRRARGGGGVRVVGVADVPRAQELGRGVGEVRVSEEGSMVGSYGEEEVGVERCSSNGGRRSSGSGEKWRRAKRGSGVEKGRNRMRGGVYIRRESTWRRGRIKEKIPKNPGYGDG